MLKVENKKAVREVARATYRANRKRNALVIFAILLTTFLIAVVIMVGNSYWTAISERQLLMEGMDYDIALTEPRADQVKQIRSMEEVRCAGVAVKCAILESCQGKALDKTRLYWLDRVCWEEQTLPALESREGSYPRKENEIMLSTAALRGMGITRPEIGMKLPVTYFTLAGEGSQASLAKTFVLSGWYRDYSGDSRGYVSKRFFKTTGVKQTDFTQGSLKITLKNPLYSKEDIIAMQKAVHIRDRQIIEADYDTIARFCKTAACLCALLLMIFASGYLFIYNALYLSISRDIRYYGQLKTVGMTSVQLKKIVRLQALWNAAAGIPLGLAAAAAVSGLVIPTLLHAANPELAADETEPVRLWVLFAAASFAFLTNLASCRKPAKMAGECSPVEAMRYIQGTQKRRVRRKEVGSVGSMARQNLVRDKKQALVIFASFIIALSVCLVINEVIRENDAKGILNEIYSCDIRLKNETTLDENRKNLITEADLSKIRAIAGVKAVRKVTSTEVVIPYQEEVYGKYYKGLYQSRYSPGNYRDDMKRYRENPEDSFFTARFISVDGEGFEKLNESLGNTLNQKAFEAGKIAVSVKAFLEEDCGMAEKTVRFSLPESPAPRQTHSVRIAAEGDKSPAYFAGGYTPDLVVSEQYARRLMGDKLFTELLEVEYEESFSRETEEQVKAVFADEKQISSESKLDRYSEMKRSEEQIRVLGSSLGILIAALALLNYLNMMAASVQNRARELATLESIGMTAKQIRRMLRLEGFGYAGISSAVSLLAGLPVSYFVFKGTTQYAISFSVPWLSDLLLLAAVLFLCVTAPVVIYNRTQRDSIVERLRSGEE